MSRARSGIRQPQYALRFQQQLPQYPIVDEWFPMQVVLQDTTTDQVVAMKLPLTIELLYANMTPVTTASVLEVTEAARFAINDKGVAHTQACAKQLTKNHGGVPFIIRISARTGDRSAIAAAVSRAFTVVSYRLSVIKNVPDVWYKDEGGRDKAMQVELRLLDKNGSVCTNRNVALLATLRYEGDMEVKNQGILKMPHDNTLVVRDGCCSIRVRIDEVSKNHQKQRFCVRFDPAPGNDQNSDIGGCITKSVMVRSKRNKKKRGVSHSGARQKRTKIEPGVQFSHPQSLTTQRTRPVIDEAAVNNLPRSGLGGGIRAVVGWCQGADQTFGGMEWQLIGYETNDDGTQNTARPIYRCPGCWVYRDTFRQGVHRDTCRLQMMRRTYEELGPQLQKLMNLATSNQRAALSASSTAPQMISASTQQFQAPLPPAQSQQQKQQGQPSLTQDANGLTEPSALELSFQSSVPDSSLGMNMGSGDLLDFGFGNSLLDMGSSPMEDKVALILMENISNHGYPAFSANKELVGFYQFSSFQRSLEFTEVANAGGDVEQLSATCKAKLTPQAEVLTKEELVNLEMLKEQALLMIMERQANGFIS